MKAKWLRSHKNAGLKAKARRRGALERLDMNLKNARELYKGHEGLARVEKRMLKEIEILKTRI